MATLENVITAETKKGNLEGVLAAKAELGAAGGSNVVHHAEKANPRNNPKTDSPASGRAHEVRRMIGHNGDVWEIAVSPDDTRALSSGSDGVVILWDLGTGNEVHRLRGHSGLVRTVAFMPSGNQAVSAGDDRSIRLWDLTTGKEIRQIGAHSRECAAVAVTKDGRFAISGGFDAIRLWDIAAGKQISEFGRSAYCVTLSPDGRFAAAAGDDKTIFVFDSNTLKLLGEVKCGAHAYGLAFNRDASLIYSAGTDRLAHKWDLKTGKELNQYSGHSDAIGRITVTPDGRRLVTACTDRTARVWDTATGNTLYTLPNGGSQGGLALTSDGKIAVTTCEGGIRVLSLR